MNMRLKTYILILVLSLIAVVIAGMYLKLITNVADYRHTRGSGVSNQTLPVNGVGETKLSGAPVKSFPSITSDTLTAVSFYPPPQLSDLARHQYPAAPSQVP